MLTEHQNWILKPFFTALNGEETFLEKTRRFKGRKKNLFKAGRVYAWTVTVGALFSIRPSRFVWA